jgi:hypothetical protein
MPEPNGRRIFDAGDVQNNGFYRNGRLEEGICAAITAYWVRGCHDLGLVRMLSELGSPVKWTLAQAAYEFGQLSKGQSTADDQRSLFEAVGLQETARHVFDIGSPTQRLAAANTILGTGSGSPTCWWISLKRDGGGHAVGAQMVPGRHVVFFDANHGAYEMSIGNWPGDFAHVITTVYNNRYNRPSAFVQLDLA